MDEHTDGPADGEESRLSPSADLAYKALLHHTQMCEQCVYDSRECSTGRALIRTLREARRAAPLRAGGSDA